MRSGTGPPSTSTILEQKQKALNAGYILNGILLAPTTPRPSRAAPWAACPPLGLPRQLQGVTVISGGAGPQGRGAAQRAEPPRQSYEPAEHSPLCPSPCPVSSAPRNSAAEEGVLLPGLGSLAGFLRVLQP